MIKQKISAWLALLLTTTLLSACAQTPSEAAATPPIAPSGMVVRMLAVNVGKADALIIQAGDFNFLVDAGTSKTFEQVEAALKALGITHLDAVFLTHTDKDHGGGLKKLAQSGLSVAKWVASAFYVDKTTQKHQAVVAANLRGQEVAFLKAGDEVVFSSDVRFEVVGPVELAPDSENNNSLVMVLHTPQGRMLLTGDMQVQEELSILKTGALPACQVLKVGHHGDNTASSYNLLAAVRPQVAVISTSTQQEKDTPSPDVLLSLARVGAQVFVTQDAGDGVLVTLLSGTATAEHVTFD